MDIVGEHRPGDVYHYQDVAAACHERVFALPPPWTRGGDDEKRQRQREQRHLGVEARVGGPLTVVYNRVRVYQFRHAPLATTPQPKNQQSRAGHKPEQK